MNIKDVLGRFETIVKDIALVAAAVKAIEQGLSERAQAQPIIAENIASVRAGLEDVHAYATETHAQLAADAAPKRPARAAKKTAKRASKKR